MKTSNKSTIYIIFAVIVLLVGVGGFYGGILFQKAQAPTTTAAAVSGSGFASGAGGSGFASRFGGGGIGTVSAVSSTSITITPRSRGGTAAADKTYAIGSSTTITDNGATVAASDIAVGDNVLVQTSTSDTSTATTITVNPSFGGGGAASGTGSSSSTGN